MSKDDWVYVKHMLDQAEAALRHTTAIDRAKFDQDELLRLALTHLIQTIGEAARHISPEFRLLYPDLPWKQIVGMRHKLVHDYVHVDYDLVWDTVTQHLSPLRLALVRMIQAEETEEGKGEGAS
jgi:uncharacterized protein with HEPN domain